MHSSNSNFAEDLALAGQGVKIFYKSNSRATQFWSPPSVEGRPPPFLQKRDREANKGDLHPPFASTCVRLWRHISGNPLHGASQCVRIPLLSPPCPPHCIYYQRGRLSRLRDSPFATHRRAYLFVLGMISDEPSNFLAYCVPADVKVVAGAHCHAGSPSLLEDLHLSRKGRNPGQGYCERMELETVWGRCVYDIWLKVGNNKKQGKPFNNQAVILFMN